jgi:hypothetical protein
MSEIKQSHIVTLNSLKYKAIQQELLEDDAVIKVIDKYIIYYKKGSATLRLHKGAFSNFWTVEADDGRKSTFNYNEIIINQYSEVEQCSGEKKTYYTKFWITFNRNGREYNNLIEKKLIGINEDDIKSYCNVKYANFGARIVGDILIHEVRE